MKFSVSVTFLVGGTGRDGQTDKRTNGRTDIGTDRLFSENIILDTFSSLSTFKQIAPFHFLSFHLFQDRILSRGLNEHEKGDDARAGADEEMATEIESDKRFPYKLPKYICLNDGLGKMRLRKSPVVIRIHNSKKKDGHEQ